MNKTEYVFKILPISQIERDLNQPRRDFGTEGDANRLLLSIKEYGIEQPICQLIFLNLKIDNEK